VLPPCVRAGRCTCCAALRSVSSSSGLRLRLRRVCSQMYLGGPAGGAGSSQPLKNDVIVGNSVVAGGKADKNSLWMSDDTSSKYINNDFQDYIFALGGLQNDVEDNAIRSLGIKRDAGTPKLENNTFKQNVMTDKTVFSYGAAGTARLRARSRHPWRVRRQRCAAAHRMRAAAARSVIGCGGRCSDDACACRQATCSSAMTPTIS
jgi:hypothetical protein